MYVHLILRVLASDVEESTITKYAESKKSIKAQKKTICFQIICVFQRAHLFLWTMYWMLAEEFRML